MGSLLGGLIGSHLGSRLGDEAGLGRGVASGLGAALGAGLGGGLGSRRGRKHARKALRYLTGGRGGVSPVALLGSAGAAWGLYELVRRRSEGRGGDATIVVPSRHPLPVDHRTGERVLELPAPPAHTDREQLLRATRVALSAARADGVLGEEEHAFVRAHARAAGIEDEIEADWIRPRPLKELLAGAAAEPLSERRALYALAFSIARCDEDVRGAERVFLAQLASSLELDPQETAGIEAEAAAGIEAQTEESPA